MSISRYETHIVSSDNKAHINNYLLQAPCVNPDTGRISPTESIAYEAEPSQDVYKVSYEYVVFSVVEACFN